MRLLLHIALVAGGSAVGGLARWGLNEASARLLSRAWPWPYGTFFINVSGCLLLGWLATILSNRVKLGQTAGVDELRLLLGVGFCGAYTTFSTFGVEADSMFRDGSRTAGYLYVALSVLVGLLAVRLGAYLGDGV